MRNLFSIIESAAHPDLAKLYQRLDIRETRLTSVRKAIQELKRQTPEIIVADFLYGYGNNYAGVNISNLDVFLYSLQKYTSDAHIIILAEKSELQYVDRLAELFDLYAVLTYPVAESDLQTLLVQD